MSTPFDHESGGHGGDLAQATQRWALSGNRLIDFSSNVNPLGPPEGLLEHLSEALPEIVHYPSPQARELREKLSFFLGLNAKRLLLGNGVNELIHLLVLWKQPRRIFVPAPTFSEYERAANLIGAQVKRYPLPPGEKAVPQTLKETIGSGDLVVFCNPSNPTGKLYSARELLSLIRAVEEREAVIMIDESFIPLSGCPEESLRHTESNNLWIALSLTKLWALPGLRLGCLIGPEQDIAVLTRWGDPWRVNILAQKAGLYCLSRENYLAKTLAMIETERCFLTERLGAIGGLRIFEGAANYLLVQGMEPGFEAADCQDYLARRGVLIRRADNFFGLDSSYFRVAVLKRSKNNRLIAELESYMKKLRAGSTGPTSDNEAEKGGFSGGTS